MAKGTDTIINGEDSGIIGNDSGAVSDSINDDGIKTIDPIAGSTDTGTRRRGRPAGSGNKTGNKPVSAGTKTQKTSDALGGVERILYALHMAAGTFITPELAISEEESKKLTQALASVNEFYGQVIDPKKLAWIDLITVAGQIYAPRIGAIILAKKMKPKVNKAPSPVQTAPQAQTPQKQNDFVKAFSDPSFIATVSDE